MSNTEALRAAAQAVLDRWDSPQWEWTKHGPTAGLMHALRAALAQQPAALAECHDTDSPWLVCKHCHAAGKCDKQPAASGEPAEPLKGWKLNHVQKGPEEGMAEIGYLDPEDGHFSPIVTVDTDLYYQPGQALPLAVAILGALADATPHPAPARVPPGWVLVPVEPTPEMLDAFNNCALCTGYVPEGYRAMLAAAPGAPDAPSESNTQR